ncbi:amylo-alpha-1,6-glucosidase [Butyrivibrio sp. MC2013]|uniref:amylo-alpha-1,6-glucosidase n=1 Tax=Butyrivibrio sp. MC2013 TaxID=1280686 RepID=UPI00047EC409|nr:amylo-alpha-1,6-glucosidase [Butyrivibrio sp. MC2013]
MISFYSDNELINRAARIALGDIRANYLPYCEKVSGDADKTCDVGVSESALSDDKAADTVSASTPYMTEKKMCVMAGLDYDTPWTRDTAINTGNAVALLDPDVAKNTMLSVLEVCDGRVRVGGQYWDKILWIIAADRYCDITGDDDFRSFALEVADNTFIQMEEEEYDPADGLFRGAAVYGDGISAYPDRYAHTEGGRSGILDWPGANKGELASSGCGVPMKALSTNIAYCEAYRAAARMWEKCISQAPVKELDPADMFIITKDMILDAGLYNGFGKRGEFDTELWRVKYNLWNHKALALKDSINAHFWNEKTGRYDYIFDDKLRCDYTEAIGQSFAILFDIADDDQIRSIAENTYISPEGIPVVWPAFPRYRYNMSGELKPGDTIDSSLKIDDHACADEADDTPIMHYGRHSGTVWPHAQGFWALAMRKAGYGDKFDTELKTMALRAVRDMQFAEIYHPVTGEIYGGLQELEYNMILWKSCDKQTWSGTAFWSMIFYGIAGLKYQDGEFTIDPYLPEGMNEATITGLPMGDKLVNVRIWREDGKVKGEIC